MITFIIWTEMDSEKVFTMSCGAKLFFKFNSANCVHAGEGGPERTRLISVYNLKNTRHVTDAPKWIFVAETENNETLNWTNWTWFFTIFRLFL